MALKKYVPATEKVFDGNGQEVGDVHGLSLNAIIGLVNMNREAMDTLFQNFSGTQDLENIISGNANEALLQVAHACPMLVAQIIALATDAHDAEGAEAENVLSQILDFPVGLQIEFLTKIMPLTFNAAGGLKKFLALIQKASAQNAQGVN